MVSRLRPMVPRRGQWRLGKADVLTIFDSLLIDAVLYDTLSMVVSCFVMEWSMLKFAFDGKFCLQCRWAYLDASGSTVFDRLINRLFHAMFFSGR